jgi:hypothetical protein
MSLFGNQNTTPDLHSLQVTQSLFGICIPIVYGQNRVTLNLLWYGDFDTQQGYISGGKGIGKDGTNYDYFAAVVGVLCQGAIEGIGNIWAQNGRLTLQTVSEPYVVPQGGGTYTVANAARFQADNGVSASTPYNVTANDYGSPGPVTLNGTTPTSLTPVEGTPGAGQYSQSGASYTFPAEDAGTSVTVNYSFSLYVLAETEDYNIPDATPFEITVQYQPQFNADLGVVFVDTGIPLEEVHNAPTGPGTYTTNGGNYLFWHGDASRPVAISYNWSQSTENVDPTAKLQFTLLEGERGQAAWSYLTSKHLSQALGYSTLALICAPNMNLGAAGELPNYNYEVYAQFQFGGGIVDADLALVIQDFLQNTIYGVGFTGALDTSLMTVARNYWAANSFFISPLLNSARTATETIEQWCEAGNTGVFWSEGKMKFIPYGDTTVVGNGYIFTPTTSPLVDLDDDDFIADDNTDPVQIGRTLWQDAYNQVTVQYTNRANDYNSNSVVEQDDWAISTYGLRPEGQKDYDFICTQDAALFTANTRLKRLVNIRKTYTFKISGLRYCFLEPMDLVTITDVLLGLNKEPARITEIEENEDRTITVTCEEFPWGTATPTLYPKQPNLPPPPPPALASPGNTIVSDLFEPSSRVATTLANSAFQIWAALTGGPEWGGCNIWFSLDNESYQQLPGQQRGTSRAGLLTANLPAGADPDLSNTLSVSITGELFNVTKAQADALSTLCKVGTEYISYQNATLTGSDGLTHNSYNLTYLRRGAFSSPDGAHSATDPSQNTFVRLDTQIYQYSYDPSLAGKTVYFKFPAFNLLGNQLQSLPDVPAFPFTIGGANVANNMTVDSVLDPGGATASIRIYKTGAAVGTPGSVSLNNGATLILPAFIKTGNPLSTLYYVNYDPSTSSYVFYTDQNQYLSDEILLGDVRIGSVTTASDWFYIPLQGGGTMAIGAGNGGYGASVPLPPGYNYANYASFASVRAAWSSAQEANGVFQSTAANGTMLSAMENRNSSTTQGTTNWLALAWTPGAAVTVTSTTGGQFIQFTTAMGDALCVYVGNIYQGNFMPAPPAGFAESRMLAMTGMASVINTGHALHGVYQCNINSNGSVNGFYSDKGSGANYWGGGVNIFALYYQTGGNVNLQSVAGGSAINIPLPNNHGMAFTLAYVQNNTSFGIPPQFSSSSTVSVAAMAGFGPSGDNNSHGWTACQTTGLQFSGVLEDGEGHTWDGFGNIFAVSTF